MTVLASANLPNIGITVHSFTAGLASGVGPWLAAALGLAVALLAVIHGWASLRQVIDAREHDDKIDRAYGWVDEAGDGLDYYDADGELHRVDQDVELGEEVPAEKGEIATYDDDGNVEGEVFTGEVKPW